MARERLRALVVATRPPFPPTSGGSVTLHALLQSLSGADVDVRVVALGESPGGTDPPYPIRRVARRRRAWWRALPAVARGTPLAVARYRVEALAAAVEEEISAFAPHVVHLEQLHLAWLIPVLADRAAVVLRQQNVESLLLARYAALLPVPLRRAARYEVRRVRRFEAQACSSATLVAAISEVDAAALRTLAPLARVEVLPAAIAFEPVAPPRLPGSPPFLCLGSFDWPPNRDGARWLLRQVWPELRRRAPDGVLHLAGPGSPSVGPTASPSVVRHGAVPSAASLYDPAAVVLIPLRAGSGVRMRLVEAWAAGVPAVVSEAAAEGLVAHDGDGALVASSPRAFAAAAARVAFDSATRAAVVARGRARLPEHAGSRVAARARELYLHALDRPPRPPGR